MARTRAHHGFLDVFAGHVDSWKIDLALVHPAIIVIVVGSTEPPPKRKTAMITMSEACQIAAAKTVEAAGAAGGIDEVRRLAEKGWPDNRGLDGDSAELRAAIKAEAARIVAEVDAEV